MFFIQQWKCVLFIGCKELLIVLFQYLICSVVVHSAPGHGSGLHWAKQDPYDFIIHYLVINTTWKTRCVYGIHSSLQFIVSCRMVVYFCSDSSSCVLPICSKHKIYLFIMRLTLYECFWKVSTIQSVTFLEQGIILTGTLSRAADWQNEWLRLHAALPVTDWVGAKIIYNLCRSKGACTEARKEDICKWFTSAAFISLVQTSQLLPKLLH